MCSNSVQNLSEIEKNRISVIDDVAHFRRKILKGAQISERFSGGACTKLHKTWRSHRPSSLLTEFISDFAFLAGFRTAAGSKSSGVENEAKFRTFDTPYEK